MKDVLERVIPRFKFYDSLFSSMGQGGYTIALNIRNVTPEFYHSTYPEEWIDQYTSEGYVFCDPVIQYLATHEGATRWSDIHAIPIPIKTKNFRRNAENFGLKYGLAVARTHKIGRKIRHLLSISRSDREFTDMEIKEAASMFEAMLAQVHPEHHLSERMLRILTDFANGGTASTAAKAVRVSEATVKKDLEAIRNILGAKTSTEAVAQAIARGLIQPMGYPNW